MSNPSKVYFEVIASANGAPRKDGSRTIAINLPDPVTAYLGMVDGSRVGIVTDYSEKHGRFVGVWSKRDKGDEETQTKFGVVEKEKEAIAAVVQ